MPRIPCVADTLHLAITDTLKSVTGLVTCLKKRTDIVSYYHRSNYTKANLRKFHFALNFSQKCFRNDRPRFKNILNPEDNMVAIKVHYFVGCANSNSASLTGIKKPSTTDQSETIWYTFRRISKKEN